MAKTREDLVNQALGALGLLAAGQTPAAEDFDAVDDHVEPLIAELSARDIVVVDDLTAIDDEIFLPLANLLADEAAPAFGLTGMPAPQGTDPKLAAESRIREVLYARPTYEPQKTEYY